MTSSIDVGRVISQVFDLYKKYAGVLLPIAAVLFLVVGILEWLLDDDVWMSLLVSLVVTIVSTLYTGVVVNLVDDVRDGRLDQSVGQLFGRASAVLVTLVIAGIIVGIITTIGFILIIVPGLIALTFFAVVAPSIVVERRGVFEAMSRSIELVKGNFFSVLAVIFVMFLIGFGLALVFGIIGAAGGDGLRGAMAYVARVVTAPLGALAAAVLFFDLKAAHGESTPAATPAPASPAGPPDPFGQSGV